MEDEGKNFESSSENTSAASLNHTSLPAVLGLRTQPVAMGGTNGIHAPSVSSTRPTEYLGMSLRVSLLWSASISSVASRPTK